MISLLILSSFPPDVRDGAGLHEESRKIVRIAEHVTVEGRAGDLYIAGRLSSTRWPCIADVRTAAGAVHSAPTQGQISVTDLHLIIKM